MERFRIEVGNDHGVKPANIVGAIINEAGLSVENIGRIKISDAFSTVDLPEGIPKDIFMMLKKVWVSGQQLQISRLNAGEEAPRPHDKNRIKKAGKKGKRKDKFSRN
jgi:ATP-dependent RNA helicase DeaD